MDKIKGANGYINFSKEDNFLDIFKPKEKKEKLFSVDIGNIYVYNSNIEKDDEFVYLKNASYILKKIKNLNRIYINGEGNFISNYNMNFSTNTIIRIKDSLATITGKTKILNYNFENKGKFTFGKNWSDDFRFSLVSNYENINTLDYNDKKQSLVSNKKGNGFFKVKFDFINKEEFILRSYIKSKNVDIKFKNEVLFKDLNIDVDYVFTKDKNILKIKNMKSKLINNYNLDIKGELNKTDNNYNIYLETNSNISKNYTQKIISKKINLEAKGKIKLDINTNNFKINKSVGKLNFKIKEYEGTNYKLKGNILFKDGFFSMKSGVLNLGEEDYKLKISKIDLTPYLVSSKNKINGNLELSKKDFSIKTDISLLNTKKGIIYDLDKLKIKTNFYPKIESINNIKIKQVKNDFKISKNSILLGKSKFSIDIKKDINKKYIFKIVSKKGNLSNLLEINKTFYLPKKLKNTEYKDLVLEFSVTKNDTTSIYLKELSFYSLKLEDKVYIKGNVKKKSKEIIFNNIDLNIGGSDLKIKEKKNILNVKSKYFDFSLFSGKNNNSKKHKFDITKIVFPEKK